MTSEQKNKTKTITEYCKKILLRHKEEKKTNSIQNEEELSEYIALHGVRTLGRSKLKEKLQSIHQKTIRKQKQRRLALRAIAASVVFFLVGSYLVFDTTFNKSMSPEELFASHFEPYPSLFEQKSSDDSTHNNSLTSQAMKAYSNKRFDQAYQLFTNAESQNVALNQVEKFYFAISMITLNKQKEAVELLSDLNENPGGPLEEQVSWYLAMAYLKSNQVDEAKQVLNEIGHRASSQFKKKESKSIIRSLSRN